MKFRCALILGWALLPVLSGTIPQAAETALLPDGSLYQAESRWRRDDGATIKLADLRGRVRVVSMFFTGCDNLCPMLLGQLKALETAMSPALKREVGFVMVTLDSKADTSGALAAYRKQSGLSADRWVLLRGSPDDTRELAALLGVKYSPKTDLGRMGHTGLIAILDRDGRMVSHVEGITDQKAFLADLSRTVSSGR